MHRKLLYTAIVAGAVAAPASAQNLLTNGGFETGDFTGWTANATGAGDILATNLAPNAMLPMSALAANGPAGGDWYATTDQDEPASYELYQFFTVPQNPGPVIVSYDLAVTSLADFVESEQAVKIEVFALDVARGGLPATLFHDAPAPITQDVPNPYVHYDFDLSADVVPGQTYIFYFSQITQNANLIAALDNVRVTPTPGAAAIALMGLPLATRRRRR